MSRLEEQEHFLSWLIGVITDKKIDLLIVAGDIYDTPNPPADAIKLFYNFLHRLSSETECYAHIIAGNHDSGAFIEAPRSLLLDKRVELIGKLNLTELHTVTHGDVEIQFLPFFRSYEVLQAAKKMKIEERSESEEDGDLILRTLEKLIRNGQSKNAKHRILIAHHIFGNMDRVEMGGSEQVISLSGLDSIPNSLLVEHFDYVALGHIHKKATLKSVAPVIRYCGAPLPFRFSENYKKSITLIETGDDLSFSEIEIPTFRELISLRSTSEQIKDKLKELKAHLNKIEKNSLPVLLEIQLTSTDPLVGMADSIRNELNDLPVELLSLRTIIEGKHNEKEEELILQGLPAMDKLFEMFYFTKHPDSKEIPKAIAEEFTHLLAEVNEQKESEQ